MVLAFSTALLSTVEMMVGKKTIENIVNWITAWDKLLVNLTFYRDIRTVGEEVDYFSSICFKRRHLLLCRISQTEKKSIQNPTGMHAYQQLQCPNVSLYSFLYSWMRPREALNQSYSRNEARLSHGVWLYPPRSSWNRIRPCHTDFFSARNTNCAACHCVTVCANIPFSGLHSLEVSRSYHVALGQHVMISRVTHSLWMHISTNAGTKRG